MNSAGYIIKTFGNSVIIAGESERGTLFGTYGFLEDDFGVRFLTSEYEHIPALSSVPLYVHDDREIPDFKYRSLYYQPAKDLKFAAKMKSEVAYASIDGTSVGGTWMTFVKNAVHSFDALVPAATYYDAHPDWYSAKEWSKSQPCLSNGLNDDGTLDDTDSYIRKMIEVSTDMLIREHESAEYFYISQNDNQNVCTCEKCLKQVQALDGSRSAQLILFLNAVAREVKANLAKAGIDSNVKFLTLSYQWSAGAPAKTDANGNTVAIVRPRDDIAITFAPITGCKNHSVNDPDCDTNAMGVGKAFEDWGKICSDFTVFDYTVNFHDYLSWYPNFSIIKSNLLYFKQKNVAAAKFESSQDSNSCYQQDLEMWLYGKLMWDTSLDLQALISEFNRYYFGERAGKIADEYVTYMNSHFEYVSQTQRQSVLHASIYTSGSSWLVSSETLSESFIDGAYGYSDKMYAAIANDSSLTAEEKARYLLSTDRLKIQIDYMKYKNYDSVFYVDEETKYEFMTEFFDDLIRLDVTRLRENGELIPIVRKQAGY